jgi:hypothetical protein
LEVLSRKQRRRCLKALEALEVFFLGMEAMGVLEDLQVLEQLGYRQELIR